MRFIMQKISDQKRVLEKLGFKYYKDTENTDYNGNICKQIASFLNNDIKV